MLQNGPRDVGMIWRPGRQDRIAELAETSSAHHVCISPTIKQLTLRSGSGHFC